MFSSSGRRPPPALLVWLTSCWEVDTLVLAIVAAALSLASTILFNVSTVSNACHGYPANQTSHCPFSVSRRADNCLLGTSIQPSIRSFYFVPNYTSHCHMSMIVGIITMLHCLILVLVAGSCRLNGRSFFASQYHLGQIVTVLTGLFWFLNLACMGVAATGYQTLCGSIDLPPCKSQKEYDPIALNCAMMKRNLVPCHQLPVTSTFGQLRAGLIVGWLLVAVLSVAALLAVTALFVAWRQRKEREWLNSKDSPLNNDLEPAVRPGGSGTGFKHPPVSTGPRATTPQRVAKPTNIQPDLEPSPTGSLARRVEEKYRLPSAFPDQMAYQPTHEEPQMMLSRGHVTSSTNV